MKLLIGSIVGIALLFALPVARQQVACGTDECYRPPKAVDEQQRQIACYSDECAVSTEQGGKLREEPAPRIVLACGACS
jgi:hypothetical protein